jgi:signal transduction histidine kinase
MRGPNRQQLLLWSAQYNKQGHHITLTTAEDLTPLYLQLRHYGGYLLISIPLFLLLVLAIQRLILRHAFKPLDLIQQEIQQLERGEIEQLHTPLPAEITPLVDEVNRLILAMVTRIKRSRNSAGNLAHTLKSPLQLLVQLAESNQLADHGTIRQQLLDQVGQIQQQIEHELTRARLAGNATPGQQFRPADELPALRQMLLQIYHDRGLNLMLHYPEAATVALDRDDMLELTGNLLDNACKWARTAVHCRIELNGRLTITIEDDGPGCAPELLQQLTKRGIRVDETTTGHGLGLAIVNEIVASYQGTIEFSSSPKLGGFKVTATFPIQG